MLTALKACGVESAQWVTDDRFMHATVKHVNRLLEASGGSLRPSAVMIPVGHGAMGGWEKLTDAKNFRVVDEDGEASVEWVGRELQPAFSIWEF